MHACHSGSFNPNFHCTLDSLNYDIYGFKYLFITLENIFMYQTISYNQFFSDNLMEVKGALRCVKTISRYAPLRSFKHPLKGGLTVF